MATTQLLPSLHIDLHDYAGEFFDDYDMEAVHRGYAAALTEAAPEGVTVYPSGEVYADVDALAALTEPIDWDEIREGVDVAALFELHYIGG